MRRSAAVLCGVTAVLAGTLTALPAEASPSVSTAALAKVAWKKCGTEDSPTLQCGSVKVPLDYARPQGRKITWPCPGCRTPRRSTRARCWSTRAAPAAAG